LELFLYITRNAIISSNQKGQVSISNGLIFTSIFIFGILKSANWLSKHEYFFKNGGKSSYMVYFARIPCIIDENDEKNNKKRD